MEQELVRLALGASPSTAVLVVAALIARLGAAAWIVPCFGGRLVPATVRLGVALALALLLYPAILPTLGAAVLAPWAILMLLFKEALVGAALGFLMGLVFWGAEVAGLLVDLSRGASLAEALVPTSGTRSSPLGGLFFQLALVLFFALGGHRLFLAALASSYRLLPLAAFPTIASTGSFALLCARLTGELLLVALSLATPVMAAVFLADVTLGVINRFAPQVNVFFLAMPAKAMLGLAVLALALGLLLAGMPLLLDRALRATSLGIEVLAR